MSKVEMFCDLECLRIYRERFTGDSWQNYIGQQSLLSPIL